MTTPAVALRPWMRRLLLTFAGLLLLLWAAPIIVAFTPLVDSLCARAAGDLNGSLQVGSVSLGWFSPIVLSDVRLRDADGLVVAEAPTIEGDRALWRLLLDQSDLGAFRVEKARINIVFANKQCNLERLLAKPADQPPHPPGTATALPKVDIALVDATVQIDEPEKKGNWQIRGIAMDARCFRDDTKSIHVNLRATLHDGAEPGALKADAVVRNVGEPGVVVTAKGQFTSLPLALAGAIARHFQTPADVTGSLQGHFAVTVVMKDGKPQIETSGDFVGNGIQVTTPSLDETLKLDRVTLPIQLRYADSILTAEKLELGADLGKAKFSGALNLKHGLPAALDQPGFDLALDVSLAMIAERLPKTLNLHKDLRMTAGNLRASVKSVVKDGSLVWDGKLKTSDIRGMKGQQMIAWSDPITLEFQARDLHKGVPLVDHLRCTSRFLNVQATTTQDRFTLSADADLAQLAEPLGQFVDLDEMKLTGKASASVNVRRLAGDHFDVIGNAHVKQLNLTWLTKRALQEPALAVMFDARGQIDKAGRQRIDAGNVTLNLGSDGASVKLTAPIVDLAKGPWGAAALRGSGDLARWQSRARSFTTSLDEWMFGGNATIETQVKASDTMMELEQTSIDATSFVCSGPGLWINEPTLSLRTTARYDRKKNEIDLAKTAFTTPSVRVDSQQLTLLTKSLGLRGTATIAGDLARLQKWAQDPKAKPGEPIVGNVVGALSFDATADRFTTAFDVVARDVIYGPPANPTWREAEVKCIGRGVYDRAKDVLQIEKVSLNAATLAAESTGTIGKVTTTRDLQLSGTLAYDLAKLEPQLRPIFGKDVKITGKDARAFKLNGALYPSSGSAAPVLRFTELKGDAGLSWNSLKAFGCDVGPAEVKAIAQQGWLQVYPIETSLNGGKLRLQPNVRLDPDPKVVVLLAGPVVEKAQITPAMCAGALAYAIPTLANAAQAEGTLSLSLNGGSIPLATPTTTEVSGTVTLHAAKIGPGPMVRELSSMFRIPPPTSLVKECKVPFTMAQGKVSHRDLELAFPDFTLKSSGTVGLDGSLALIIETTIPPQLAQVAKLTPAQAKQFVRIPVGGTLEQPRLDGRALESLTAVFGRSILENQLKQLLQPKR